MDDSILTSTKKILGLAEDYTAFDADIITHINAAFSTLTQLGIGPDEGFLIEDADTDWDEFIGTDKLYNSVKSYVFLKTKQLFDPATTSYVLASMEKQIAELEWRLNVTREGTEWVGEDLGSELIDGGDV